MKQTQIFTTKWERNRRLKIHLVHLNIKNSFLVVENPKSGQSSLILKTQKSNSKTNFSELGL